MIHQQRALSSTSIIIFGAQGRMGERIGSLAISDDAFEVRALITRNMSAPSKLPHHDELYKTSETFEKTPVFADVIIDFSSDIGAVGSLKIARAANSAMLVGTTGLSESTIEMLKSASKERAMLIAPNTSLGVCVLARLAKISSHALGPLYECSIVESHHSKKKDAPSGTALRLAKAVRDAGHALSDDQILAMRGGDVIGEHTIRFAGPGELIELTHRATQRDLFARGALTCAQWLRTQPPGWYTMEDVLNMPA